MSFNNQVIIQFSLRSDKHDEMSYFFPPVIFNAWNRAIFYVMFQMKFLPPSSCLKHKFNKFDKVDEVDKPVLKNVERHNLSRAAGKSVPLQARSGPQGSRNLTYPYFMKTAQ